jgi:hypothetical protein
VWLDVEDDDAAESIARRVLALWRDPTPAAALGAP